MTHKQQVHLAGSSAGPEVSQGTAEIFLFRMRLVLRFFHSTAKQEEASAAD